VDLANLFRVVRRHWLVVAVGLVLTLAVAVVLASQVKPEFEAKTTVLLLTPPQTQSAEGETIERNPLENPGAVAVTASALTDVMDSRPFALRMEAAGVTDPYDVEINPAGGGALLFARTTSESPDVALSSLETLLDAMRDELAGIQERAGIAQSTWISAQAITLPDEATPVAGSKTRVGLTVLVLGSAATLALAYAADRIYGDRRPWRDRKRRRGEADEVSPYASDLLSDLLDEDGGPRRAAASSSQADPPPLRARAL
jgi:uncharacterized membrane protein YdfJ with MMPL/SSD domain